MEPDVCIETGSMIRVAVIPVGGPMPQHILREYVSMLSQYTRIDLASIGSFYSEHQKSPFANQPWESGSLRFKYIVGGAPASPWEDFQVYRKILAVIGICHCPVSPDLDLVIEQFAWASKTYAFALVKRLFAFSPSEAQLEEGQEKENSIVMFNPSDQQAQELLLQTMVQDLAARLLMEFEKWALNAESSGTVLKTPLDSHSRLSSEEVIKAKKRRLARVQKTIGDYCLLAGSPVDANAHFATAIELARLTGDLFWHAGALEGSVSALMVDRMDEKDSLVAEEVKFRYYSVIQLYRRSQLQDNAQRVSTTSFELEAQLKLARYLCRQGIVKEAVDLLMHASDGANSLIDVNDRLILYVEIARLFGTIGYEHKAAFFSRQVAQLYMQQDNIRAAISAMQVLTLTAKAYRIQSRGRSLEHDLEYNDNVSNHHENGKVNPRSIISLFESQWNTLQMAVLREILMSAVRAGDPLAAWSAAARLLRSFYPLITPAGQFGLASSLGNSADRLPSGTRCPDPALPFIRLHSFPMLPSQMDIIKRNPAKKEWWTGSAPSGPFIYTPFTKGDTSDNSKQELTWTIGEPVQVLVELANPCSFNLMVKSIHLSVHSGNFDAFPVSLSLPPNTAKVISLSGIPTKAGPLSIPGCIVHCFGVITEHLLLDVDHLLLGAAHGLVLSDPFRCCGSGKSRHVSIPHISVLPLMPLLVSHAVEDNNASTLFEGEIRDIWIRLRNAGTVPVEQAHLSLAGKNQISVISIAHGTLSSTLPLNAGAEVTFPVTLKAWKLHSAGFDHDGKKSSSESLRSASTEGSNPLLVIHYAGSSSHYHNSEHSEPSLPPGRRLVVPLQICVLQGLRFVQARLLPMEAPSHVDNFAQIDPHGLSRLLHLLELELSNPTNVMFEVYVSIETEDSMDSQNSIFPKTRIDPGCTSHVLIPLQHLKLPVVDDGFFAITNDALGGKVSHLTERNLKAELAASVTNFISKVKVRWQSGRNSSGELSIKDVVKAALQKSVMDIFLPDPLTFQFRLSKLATEADASSASEARFRSSVSVHEMTDINVMIRNNTREMIQMNLTITCRDVAEDNCLEGHNAPVLWAGILSAVGMEIPPLEELAHSFSLYFLVPGEYTLLASAVVDDANLLIRARARSKSPDDPILFRGSPFRINVTGTA